MVIQIILWVLKFFARFSSVDTKGFKKELDNELNKMEKENVEKR